jgi:hypothetical protein
MPRAVAALRSLAVLAERRDDPVARSLGRRGSIDLMWLDR